MVVVRLQRRGTNKVPHHRIVVMDQRRAQGSRTLENLGHYNPATDPVQFEINESRLVFWISSGAQMSVALQRLVKRYKKISVASLRR